VLLVVQQHRESSTSFNSARQIVAAFSHTVLNVQDTADKATIDMTIIIADKV